MMTKRGRVKNEEVEDYIVGVMKKMLREKGLPVAVVREIAGVREKSDLDKRLRGEKIDDNMVVMQKKSPGIVRHNLMLPQAAPQQNVVDYSIAKVCKEVVNYQWCLCS